ncbi:MAG: hypothetical protein J4F36_13440 [Nitrosopumilaceae archaeon]|nr:hypothetical protein [Nitrosopumilaceae archaeon]
MSKPQQITKEVPQEVQDAILGKMVTLENGHEMIHLGNYALDFKQAYAFLGLLKIKLPSISKKGNAIKSQ